MLLIGYLLLALVVAAVLFYLVVALLPSGLTVTPIRDNRPMELPSSRRMRMSDLDRIRIPVSVRGYRVRETDELIDRLAAEIQVRDEEIDRLKQQGLPFRSAEQPEWAVRDLGERAAAELADESARADEAGDDSVGRDESARDESARDESARDESARDESSRDESARDDMEKADEPAEQPGTRAEQSAAGDQPAASGASAADKVGRPVGKRVRDER
jgi:hypothetical protein